MKRPNSHLYLLLGWPAYFILYCLTEKCIPPERCHLIYIALDDKIPFLEGFAVFYVGWYLLIIFSLGYFLLYDIENFRNLQVYIITTQLLAMLVYILYPSCQNLRPQVFPRENLLTDVMKLIYRLDTPTGICPSLHVAISIAIASVWLRKKDAKRWLKVLIAIFCFGVCLSVSFVKQHSVVDILAAIPVCLIGEYVVAILKRKC